MNNKHLIWLLVGLGVLTIVLTLFSYIREPATAEPVAPPSNHTSGTGILNQNLDAAISVNNTNEPSIPNPATRLSELEVLGVDSENIYQDNTPPEMRSDTTLANTQNFMITYLAGPNQFLLSLYTEPFPASQEAAEQILLTELQISQEVACRLPVVIVKVTPADSQPDEVGRKLSFCP